MRERNQKVGRDNLRMTHENNDKKILIFSICSACYVTEIEFFNRRNQIQVEFILESVMKKQNIARASSNISGYGCPLLHRF